MSSRSTQAATFEQSSEFVMAAAAAGIEFPDLIQKIVDLALDRYKNR